MLFAARVLLLCAIALSITGAAPRELSLDQLLAKMRSSYGDVYDAHLLSTSPHMIEGERMIVETDSFGLRYTLRECTAGVCAGSYFDGQRLYEFNINGTQLPLDPQPDPYLRSLRILGMLTFLDPVFVDNGGSIEDGGKTVFHGTLCRRIFVRGVDAAQITVYVDPKTGLVAGAQGGRDTSILTMSDYRRVGSIQLPFSIDSNGEPLERYITRTAEADPYDPPHGLTPTITATPAGMPIDPDSITPLGSCTIGGIGVGCLVDTGNSALAMSLELAEKLNLNPIGMLRIAGLGNYATEVVHAGPLFLGNVKFGDANYIVLTDIHRYGYDLVVGSDVFATMPVTIDYSRHGVFFGEDAPAGPDSITVPLRFQNFLPTVGVTLNNVPATLAVDTGDQSSINLAYSFYQLHSDLFSVTSTANVSGVGGSSVEMLGQLPRFRIGSLTAQNLQIGATRILKGTADGHLGAGFLFKYRIVLDYPHEQLSIIPM